MTEHRNHKVSRTTTSKNVMMPNDMTTEQYAAGLLMPEDALFKETDKIFKKAEEEGYTVKAGPLIEKISRKFQVPPKVAYERLVYLGFGFEKNT